MAFNKKKEVNTKAFNKNAKNAPISSDKPTYPLFPVKELHCAICGARKVSDNRILFTFRGDGFLVMNMALVSTRDGSTFISCPDTSYTDKTGERQYSKCAVLFFSKADTEKITEVVLDNYAEDSRKADFKTPHYIYGD